MSKHVARTSYVPKGKGEADRQQTIIFSSPVDHKQIVSHYSQSVSFGAAKAAMVCMALAENPVEVVEQLLELAVQYTPSEKQVAANPGLSAAQRTKVEKLIATLREQQPKGKGKKGDKADTNSGGTSDQAAAAA